MTAPDGLGERGRSLWESIAFGLPADWEFTEREVEILGLACRQADDLALLEAEIDKLGVTTMGSQGQVVIAPMIPEARQARLAISRLLGSIELPDDEDEPRSAAALRAQRAARSRWDRRQRLAPREDLRRGA